MTPNPITKARVSPTRQTQVQEHDQQHEQKQGQDSSVSGSTFTLVLEAMSVVSNLSDEESEDDVTQSSQSPLSSYNPNMLPRLKTSIDEESLQVISNGSVIQDMIENSVQTLWGRFGRYIRGIVYLFVFCGMCLGLVFVVYGLISRKTSSGRDSTTKDTTTTKEDEDDVAPKDVIVFAFGIFCLLTSISLLWATHRVLTLCTKRTTATTSTAE